MVQQQMGMCRKINEDNYYVLTEGNFPYAIVADGMGGYKAGEIASMMVVDVIKTVLKICSIPIWIT